MMVSLKKQIKVFKNEMMMKVERDRTVITSHDSHLLRKTLLTSSWLMGGFLELAAILRGLRKQLTRM